MIDDAPAPRGGQEASVRRGRRRPVPLWVSALGNLLAALVVVALVQAVVVRVHKVASGSMSRTLQVDDRVLSSNLPYLGSGPQRGDIVIFGHGTSWEDPRRPADPNPVIAALRVFGDLTGLGISNTTYTVKRVVGVPGDTVECCDSQGRVLVNRRPQAEPYVYGDFPFTPGSLDCASVSRSARCFAPVTVPPQRYLVLGDHRSNSADSMTLCRSRDAGPDCGRFVRRERMAGKVIAKAWPPGPAG